jgi:hypothetical protein
MPKFKIFSEEKHEYDILVEETDDGTLYSMFRSNSAVWTIAGEFIVSIRDTGGGFTFSKKLTKELDYSEFIEMKILFNLVAREELRGSQYEAIEVPENPILL